MEEPLSKVVHQVKLGSAEQLKYVLFTDELLCGPALRLNYVRLAVSLADEVTPKILVPLHEPEVINGPPLALKLIAEESLLESANRGLAQIGF